MNYQSPLPTPGLRKLAGHEESYKLDVDLDATPLDNFVPSRIPGFGKNRCGLKQEIEGFGPNVSMFWRLVIFLFVAALVIYLLNREQ